MRSFLVAAVVASASISGAAAQQQQQQQPCPLPAKNFATALARSSPAGAAQDDFERAVCEYRNCIVVNSNNINACEGLRHIMDASAQAAGHYNSSR